MITTHADPIYDFFLVCLDRKTGERIGASPGSAGSAHIKVNLPTLAFVLSYVQSVESDSFVVGLAEDLSKTFIADVYGRAMQSGEWTLLANGDLPEQDEYVH